MPAWSAANRRCPRCPTRPGKGEALWRSLAATSGDIVVFVDSDLIDPHPMFVPWLVGPLLTGDGVHLVKGFYRRPLKVSESVADANANGGGRVTELVARPLLAALRPELGCVLQPLGGEYAATRELLTSLPFAPGLRRGDRPAGRHLSTGWVWTRSRRSTSVCGRTATGR